MSPRARVLLVIVGVVGVLLTGKTFWQRYAGALTDQRAVIRGLERKLELVDADQRDAAKGREEWLNIGKQTLSMDANQAMQLLRDELFEVTRNAGLSKEQVNLGQVANWQKNGVRVLGCTVDAEGNLLQAVKFLFELSRQPYLVRCKSLTLTELGGRAAKGTLKLAFRLETPLLPSNQKVPKIVPAELEKGKRRAVPRTLFASLADYQVIADKKMTEPYVAPPPTPPAVVQSPVATQPVEVVKVAPPPPADGNLMLTRVLSSPRGQQAVLIDPVQQNNPNAQEKRVEVGEPLFGGKLVYVHPRGVVSERDGAIRFHPVGAVLGAAQPLTEQDHPEVFYEVKKLEARAAGISQRPG